MNELRLIRNGDCVIQLLGGRKETVHVLTSVRAIPPTGDNWEVLQHFEGTTAEEAQRDDKDGRQATVYDNGAVLLVDGKPVMFIDRRWANVHMKSLFEHLR